MDDTKSLDDTDHDHEFNDFSIAISACNTYRFSMHYNVCIMYLYQHTKL